MAKDINELIADDFIRHSIDLDRFAAGERLRTLNALRDLESEMIAKLKDRAKLTNFQAARTEALLQQTQATIAKRYKKIRADRKASLETVYEAEKNFVVQTANNRIGASVMTVFVDEKVTRRAVDGTLINGAPSAVWWNNQANGLKQRFENAVRTGILAGETNDQIARRIRGTKANNFEDGVMSATRREATALVRTSVQAVANKARQDTFEENIDVISQVQQRSTLDSRTTNICKSYSGLVWKMKKGPNGVEYIPDGHDKKFANVDRDGGLHYGPPRHWQCRSALVPLTQSWEELANKKVKTPGDREKKFREKFEDRLRKRGFSKDQIANIKAKTRASMNGQVPVDLNYEDWLKTQPESVQIDALGVERWRLWKTGRIDNFRQLTDNSGRPLTLNDLVKKVKPKKTKTKIKPPPPKPPKPKPKPKTQKPIKPTLPPEEPPVVDDPNAIVNKLDFEKEPENFHNAFVTAMDGQTDEMVDIANKTTGLRVVTYNEGSNGAYYMPGASKIHLRKQGWSAADQTVIHEYNHHTDWVAGKRGLPGTPKSNQSHISALANEVMEAEADELITINKALYAAEREQKTGAFAWATIMRKTDTAKGPYVRKSQLNILMNFMIDKGKLDEYTFVLKNMKRVKTDRIAWVMQKIADENITLRDKNRIMFIIEESKKAMEAFPPPVRPLMDAFEKAEDKADFLSKKIGELYAAKKIPLAEDDLRTLFPSIEGRMRAVEAFVQRDAEVVVQALRPTFDEIINGAGKLRVSFADYFGSLTTRQFGFGHDLDYYLQNERLDLQGRTVRSAQLSEMWAQYWSLKTRKEGGEMFRRIFEFFTPKTTKKFEELMTTYIKDWKG